MLQTYLVVALVSLFTLLKNYLCEVEYVQNGKQNETNRALLCKKKLVVDLALLQMPWNYKQSLELTWFGMFFFQKNCYAKLLLSSITVLFWFPHS